MAKPKSDLLQGTLDLLIRKTIDLEPMYGWGIAQRIQFTTATPTPKLEVPASSEIRVPPETRAYTVP